MKSAPTRLMSSAACVLVSLGVTALGQQQSSDGKATVEHQAETAAAVKFAETVLEHGRDTYGERQTPLLADGLNVDTMKPPARIPSWSGGEGMPNLQTKQDDPQAVFALIELFRATDHTAYLDLAHAVARNMLQKRFIGDKGLFVLDKNHLIANLDSLEPLALITLVAADRGEPDKVPTYDGGGHYAWGRTSVLSGHSVPVPGVTHFEVLRQGPGTMGR